MNAPSPTPSSDDDGRLLRRIVMAVFFVTAIAFVVALIVGARNPRFDERSPSRPDDAQRSLGR